MRRAAAVFLLSGLVPVFPACASATQPAVPAPTRPAAPAPPTASSLADLVQHSLPSVVLLLNEREDGKTTFGAGFIAQDGLVVTCLHVVEQGKTLTAMLHKPSRRGYTPMDGGLPRFLFENQSDLVPVHIVAQDATLDLAVLRIDADTTAFPKLPWATEPVRPGDRVLALGHPQETIWSFTEGVVGSLQHGIVQHDAVVGPGSSGGPLLNEKGQVVGVNVAGVTNMPRGLSYARPIDLVASVFTQRRVPIPVDASSPESAAITCWRAQELAMPEAGTCFDWESEWGRYVALLQDAKQLAVTQEARDRFAECATDAQGRELWMKDQRDSVVHVFDPSHWRSRREHKGDSSSLDPADSAFPSAFRDELANAIALRRAAIEKAEKERSVTADYKDPPKLLARIRQGLRVEQVQNVSPSLAWVLIAFKNDDGSTAKLSELYTHVGGRWLQRAHPSREEVALLPAEWPSPPMTWPTTRTFLLALAFKQAAVRAGCPFSDPSERARQGGSGPGLHPRFAP